MAAALLAGSATLAGMASSRVSTSTRCRVVAIARKSASLGKTPRASSAWSPTDQMPRAHWRRRRRARRGLRLVLGVTERRHVSLVAVLRVRAADPVQLKRLGSGSEAHFAGLLVLLIGAGNTPPICAEEQTQGTLSEPDNLGAVGAVIRRRVRERETKWNRGRDNRGRSEHHRAQYAPAPGKGGGRSRYRVP